LRQAGLPGARKWDTSGERQNREQLAPDIGMDPSRLKFRAECNARVIFRRNPPFAFIAMSHCRALLRAVTS